MHVNAHCFVIETSEIVKGVTQPRLVIGQP